MLPIIQWLAAIRRFSSYVFTKYVPSLILAHSLYYVNTLRHPYVSSSSPGGGTRGEVCRLPQHLVCTVSAWCMHAYL